MAGNIEETSYDILEWFPILYCQEVFSYLDGKDVIQASAVNKQWYKFTSERQQTKKVKLVFSKNHRWLTEEDINILRNSKRNYQKIIFHGVTFKGSENSGYFLKILADRAGSWKSVTVDKCAMVDHDMSKLLRIIEPSVEELKINQESGVGSSNIIGSRFPTKFPRLKILECDVYRYNVFKYFVGCTSLLKFHCLPVEYTSAMEKDILTLLHNNQNLKELRTKIYRTLFKYSFELKLQTLCFERDSYTDTLPDMGILCSFLGTQAQTLESLELQVEPNQDCLELILCMPKLSSLTLNVYEVGKALSKFKPVLPVNTTIISLELQGRFYPGTYTKEIIISYQILFKALPSIKRLECCEINDEILLFLAFNAPVLESLETHYFNISRVPEAIFPNIKKFRVREFHKGLQEPTGGNSFAALVRNEMRKNFKKI